MNRISKLIFHIHPYIISFVHGSSNDYNLPSIFSKSNRTTGGVINLRGIKQDSCFEYAVMAALNRSNCDHSTRASSYSKYLKNYKWRLRQVCGGNRGYTLNDIRNFERDNPSINVNVIFYDEIKSKDKLQRLYMSKNVSGNNVCNLLAVNNDRNEGHYMAITSLFSLFKLFYPKLLHNNVVSKHC